jgi:hypothetical protein
LVPVPPSKRLNDHKEKKKKKKEKKRKHIHTNEGMVIREK